jgi:predicted nucleotidyltransferase
VGVVDIVAGLQNWPEVETVVQGGSRITGVADADSAIDLYVYSQAEVPVSARRAFIEARSSCSEVDNQTWETGDEWKERASGEAVDVMYRNCNWIEGEMERVLVQHQSSLG